MSVVLMFGRCVVINVEVRPGHVIKYPLYITSGNVENAGIKRQVCRYCASSFLFLCFLIMAYIYCGDIDKDAISREMIEFGGKCRSKLLWC